MYFIKILYFITIFFLTHSSLAQVEFLSTQNTDENAIVYGLGQEAGYYVEVSFILDEITLPKNLNDEDIMNILVNNQPVLVFANNSAHCSTFQEPYMETNETVEKGTEVTYGYLIKTSSAEPNKFCNLKVYKNDSKTLLREVDYFTVKKEEN